MSYELPPCIQRGEVFPDGSLECSTNRLVGHANGLPVLRHSSVCMHPCPYANTLNREIIVPYRSSGLGDTLEEFTTRTGLKRLAGYVYKVLGNECGCPSRKKWLNDKFPYRQVREWAVGMTTCPRKEPTFNDSIASVRSAGWGDVRVFDDAARSGAWHNFLDALSGLVESSANADAYLLFQDDVQVSANLRVWLERRLWPIKEQNKIGVVSLYTPRMHHQPEPGWHKLKSSKTWGALGYVFTPLSARLLLGQATAAKPREATIDAKVGKFCRDYGLEFWLHSPSLIRHTGKTSTISTRTLDRNRQCRVFCEDAAKLP